MNDIASWIELRYEPYSSSLSPGMPHPERGRTRAPGLNEDSLKHKQAPSEKHPAVQTSKGISTRSGRTSCGSPTFPRKREVPPPMYAPSRGGSTSPSSPTCTPGGSSAGRPPVGQCAPTLPWTPWRWPSGSGNVRGADLSGLVHHLRPRRAVQVHPPRGCPVRVRGDHLGGVDGRLLLALPWPRL